MSATGCLLSEAKREKARIHSISFANPGPCNSKIGGLSMQFITVKGSEKEKTVNRPIQGSLKYIKSF